MKTEIKEKWVAALRSGAYVQTTRGYLRDESMGTSFCCLGVLADVMGASWIEGRPILDGVCLKKVYSEAKGAEDEYLSSDTLESIDLAAYDQKRLANMNDWGHSFEVIADYIERNL